MHIPGKPSREQIAQGKEWITRGVPTAINQFKQHDLRWSYIAVAGMAVVALIVNIFLPHGWTAWPFVLAIGILFYIHEAAERNGTGVPPLHVYALFFGTVALWIIVMAVLSITNPLILLLGVSWLVYVALKAYLKQRQKDKVIDSRRADGCCIHCGAKVEDPNLGVCTNCGLEPNPSEIQLARIASMVTSANRSGNARAALTPQSNAAAASTKEKAFMASRPRPGQRPPRGRR